MVNLFQQKLQGAVSLVPFLRLVLSHLMRSCVVGDAETVMTEGSSVVATH